jgi:hypothetical protein
MKKHAFDRSRFGSGYGDGALRSPSAFESIGLKAPLRRQRKRNRSSEDILARTADEVALALEDRDDLTLPDFSGKVEQCLRIRPPELVRDRVEHLEQSLSLSQNKPNLDEDTHPFVSIKDESATTYRSPYSPLSLGFSLADMLFGPPCKMMLENNEFAYLPCSIDNDFEFPSAVSGGGGMTRLLLCQSFNATNAENLRHTVTGFVGNSLRESLSKGMISFRKTFYESIDSGMSHDEATRHSWAMLGGYMRESVLGNARLQAYLTSPNPQERYWAMAATYRIFEEASADYEMFMIEKLRLGEISPDTLRKKSRVHQTMGKRQMREGSANVQFLTNPNNAFSMLMLGGFGSAGLVFFLFFAGVILPLYLARRNEILATSLETKAASDAELVVNEMAQISAGRFAGLGTLLEMLGGRIAGDSIENLTMQDAFMKKNNALYEQLLGVFRETYGAVPFGRTLVPGSLESRKLQSGMKKALERVLPVAIGPKVRAALDTPETLAAIAQIDRAAVVTSKDSNSLWSSFDVKILPYADEGKDRLSKKETPAVQLNWDYQDENLSPMAKKILPFRQLRINEHMHKYQDHLNTLYSMSRSVSPDGQGKKIEEALSPSVLIRTLLGSSKNIAELETCYATKERNGVPSIAASAELPSVLSQTLCATWVELNGKDTPEANLLRGDILLRILPGETWTQIRKARKEFERIYSEQGIADSEQMEREWHAYLFTILGYGFAQLINMEKSKEKENVIPDPFFLDLANSGLAFCARELAKSPVPMRLFNGEAEFLKNEQNSGLRRPVMGNVVPVNTTMESYEHYFTGKVFPQESVLKSLLEHVLPEVQWRSEEEKIAKPFRHIADFSAVKIEQAREGQAQNVSSAPYLFREIEEGERFTKIRNKEDLNFLAMASVSLSSACGVSYVSGVTQQLLRNFFPDMREERSDPEPVHASGGMERGW